MPNRNGDSTVLLITTDTVIGRNILRYCGIVSARAIIGT